MKLAKRGAVTIAFALTLFLIALGLLTVRVVNLETSYQEQTRQFELVKDEYNSIYSQLETEKAERIKYQNLYDHLSVENNQLKEELNN